MAVKGKTKASNSFFKKISWNYLKDIFVNPSQSLVVAVFIILTEIVLNILIVEKVPYTEIDWKAYMQECEGFLNGTFDYSKLKGDTGPLVYPAGFVYVYSLLYYLTNQGVNIRLAQYIFIGIYVLQLCFVFQIYIKTKKVPPYVLLVTILTSYRIHSIYVLRLFNDPIAVLFFYASLNLFLNSRWYFGSIFYSIAVSIKMNILLYAPALFFFYLINLGINDTLKQLCVCGLIQILLGLPFLLSNPVAYIKGSFDLGRVFNHTWTVNYRFLDIHVFENRCFHLILFLLHVILLIIFLPMCIKYFKSYCRLRYVQTQIQPQINKKNLENRRKNNLKNISKSRKNDNKKAEQNEKLTKQQEDFLNSFEKSLQKSQNDGRKYTNEIEHKEETQYSIDFDILSQLFILPMFIVNFIGVVCARSLHYQFYSWYFHSLPYLVWSCNYSTIIRFLILAVIELCWNTYPSTHLSSALLHICHLVIMYGVYHKMSKELTVASKVS